jgi:hypothetical protein
VDQWIIYVPVLITEKSRNDRLVVVFEFSMSIPKKPAKTALFASVIYSPRSNIEKVVGALESKFGKILIRSDEMIFNQTDYYIPEMGEGLKRIFVVFEDAVERDRLPEIKLFTNGIEDSLKSSDSRTVNIDPGLLNLENLVLATGKNFSHRIYLGQGIFAEITLIFKSGSFRSLEWTFPDYASNNVIEFFNCARESYRERLR